MLVLVGCTDGVEVRRGKTRVVEENKQQRATSEQHRSRAARARTVFCTNMHRVFEIEGTGCLKYSLLLFQRFGNLDALRCSIAAVRTCLAEPGNHCREAYDHGSSVRSDKKNNNVL